MGLKSVFFGKFSNLETRVLVFEIDLMYTLNHPLLGYLNLLF